MSSGSVLVIGEALIDIVEGADGPREFVGGSPANVAFGVARQNIPVRLLTHIGRDARGAHIAAHLAAAGAGLLDTSWGGGATSTARARLQPDGSAQYEFDIDWRTASPALEDVSLIHTGSIALFLDPGAETVLQTLAAAPDGTLVTVDPNIRPALIPDPDQARERFARAARAAHIVKLSDEDAEWLAPGVAPEKLLADIASLGPRLVVMTRGGDGALALAEGEITPVAPVRVDVADTIGAGDAFMASLIVSALRAPELFTEASVREEILRRAALTAAITVSRAGANPPTAAEVDAALDG